MSTRDEFSGFVEDMLADFRAAGRAEWENATLERFLDALLAFAAARWGEGEDHEAAMWRLFAEMLAGAIGYEKCTDLPREQRAVVPMGGHRRHRGTTVRA